MRKISYLFALLVSFIAFNACTSDVDNYFPESAPERASKTVAEVKKTLQEASNGWRMEYYGDVTYGGYNVLCKFQGDSVLIASEKAGKNHEAGLDASGNLITESSLAHFTVNQSMGVVVSFDTYNKLFHYFADPKNDDYGEAGTGFGGDFEFRVLKCTSDTIVLQGLKHGDRILMLPMKADQDWASYLQEVEDVKKFMASSSYTLLSGTDTLAEATQYGDYHSLIFQYPDSTGSMKAYAYPYIVTPEGYKFYKEVEIGGKKFTNFSKDYNDPSDERFYPQGDASICLETVVPPVVDAFKKGQWFFDGSKVGPYAEGAWNDFMEAIKTAANGKEAILYQAMIGTYNNKFGFHAWLSSDYLYVELTVRDPNEAGDEMALQYNRNSPTNKAAQVFMKSYKLTPVLKTFSALNNKLRLKMETDNPRKPTYMKLIQVDHPENVLELTATQVMYPFGGSQQQ